MYLSNYRPPIRRWNTITDEFKEFKEFKEAAGGDTANGRSAYGRMSPRVTLRTGGIQPQTETTATWKAVKGPVAVPGLLHPYRWFSLIPGFVRWVRVLEQLRKSSRRCHWQTRSRKHLARKLLSLLTSELRRETKTFEGPRIPSLA